MNVSGMVADLNREIARLTQIRDLLTETDTLAKAGPGRPKGSGKKITDSRLSQPAPKRQPMSKEAREKIATAQRNRWAASKHFGKTAPRPGIVKTIRATPPTAKKAPSKPVKAAGKGIPVKFATAKKRPAKTSFTSPATSESGVPTPANS